MRAGSLPFDVAALRCAATARNRAAYPMTWWTRRGRSVVAVEGDRLLCPRDYLGIAHLPELVAAGVASLKIEGRMKNPDYVFNVVRVWRRALDMLRDGAWDADAVPALERELGRSFNRGFTDAYLRGRSGAELMSFERAINQGVRVGHLVAVGHEEVTVELDAAVAAVIRSRSDFTRVPTRVPMCPSAGRRCLAPWMPLRESASSCIANARWTRAARSI